MIFLLNKISFFLLQDIIVNVVFGCLMIKILIRHKFLFIIYFLTIIALSYFGDLYSYSVF